MNAAHLHLIVNHAPLFGLVAGLTLLGWGVLRNSREIRIASYVAFILSALAAIAAYATGGGAEAIVEDLPGMTERAIERHEDAARLALFLIGVSGVGGLLGFFVERQEIAFRKIAFGALFAVALVALGVVGYAANLGGLIHHTEIATPK